VRWFLVLATLAAAVGLSDHRRPIAAEEQDISPWTSNPRYWMFKGQPTLLLGGSDDDNLFQWPAELLEPHLNQLRQVGGNYVRNTMSDRPDRGFEQYAFARRADGKYDLNAWNPEYWTRFERFLQWTHDRDIIVQIEVWDRFDYSLGNWRAHPFNPSNNVNYTHEASGLASEYPKHPGANVQPFFFTTPNQRNTAIVLQHQQRFVDRMLAATLKFGHVLYCIDNETSGDEAWSRYWADYIKSKASAAGRRVYVTEMWDDWDITAERHRRTLDHPERYAYADLSQNNHNSGALHWRRARWAIEYVASRPRPINAVKTYGADGNRFGHTDQDGLERFFRHILAGFAGARFHRPDSGLGLNAKAQSAIATVRRLESVVRFWELSAAAEVLSNGQGGDVYTATGSRGQRVFYFPVGGRATVMPGNYEIAWVGPGGTLRREQLSIPTAGGDDFIVAPDRHWFAVLEKR
jgi:hypothetical protein